MEAILAAGVLSFSLLGLLIWFCWAMFDPQIMQKRARYQRHYRHQQRFTHQQRQQLELQRQLDPYWRELIALTHDVATAERLVQDAMIRYPAKEYEWYFEKVIYDLERDRR